jgi:hypothetical protein
MAPVVGEWADGVNCGWYGSEGDAENAAYSCAAAVPFLGWLAVAAKLRKGLKYGQELVHTFDNVNAARNAARELAGLGDNAVDFVQKVGPMKGRVTGRMSPDGKRGWRIDYDSEKGFHINWWDRTGGNKRESWLYGANIVDGGSYEQYLDLLSHFPG